MKSFKQYVNEKVIFPQTDDYYQKAAEFFISKIGEDPNAVDVVIRFKKNLNEVDGLCVKMNHPSNNKYVVYIDESHRESDLLRVICHEMVHICQIHRGDLEYSKGGCNFKGNFVSYKQTPYKMRPHEMEAKALDRKWLYDWRKNNA